MRVGNAVSIDARRSIDRPDFRQPEIENLGVPARGDKQVRRLDVTMDNAGGMRRFQTVGDLDRERKQRIDRDRFALNRCGASA